MGQLTEFKNFVEKINKENGRTYKLSVLTEYKNNDIIKYFLRQVYDPFIIFGISNKKLNKVVKATPDISWTEVPEDKVLFDWLRVHNTGTDVDIATVQQFKNLYITPDCYELFDRIITKDLQLGLDVKSINKVFPKLCFEFNVQLAEKYFEHPDYVEGKAFAITEKIDGCRIVAIKEKGKVSFYTRQGQEYDGLVDLEKELSSLKADNFILDGELTLLDPGELDSGEQYKATTKLCRTKDTEKHGLKMLVFDYMPVKMFREQNCTLSYVTRRSSLPEMLSGLVFFKVLPILYAGKDTNKITEILNKQVALGNEGIMINIIDATYKFKRTKDLLKCKLFNTADLQIIGFESGINKYENTLGALLLEYKGNIVSCGSGFTDEQRTKIWANRNTYLNTIVEVSYFEETTNASGGVSLRFPIFKDFRPDKSEPNY